MDLSQYEGEAHLTLWFSNVAVHQNHPGGLFTEKLLGPVPRDNNLAGGVQECAFLTSDTAAAHLGAMF